MNCDSIVITGIGILAANASSASAFADALRDGRSGIGPISRFDPGTPCRLAAEVNLPDDETTTLDRVSRLACAAALQAVADAGLEVGGSWSEDAGLAVGTSRGSALSLARWVNEATEAADRLAILDELPFYSIARNIARALDLHGPTSTVTMACVSSSLAIGRAFDLIRRRRARIMIAGGPDALTHLSFSGFSVLRAMTRTACRPFDRHRDGMVLGEGAGMLILEDGEHARRRGARIYAEICGWGSAGDAHHSTSPHPSGRGLTRALHAALAQARVPADSVDHINLHGTATAANDPAECQAVRRVFGDRCWRLPVNSLKPMIGHTLGASGVLELAGSVLAMRGGFVAPTLNHTERDPDCALDVVSGESRDQPLATLVSTKSAFGGANVAIVARRPS
jgi:3-oxoacyl-(acyl-carrier-protein) synthase